MNDTTEVAFIAAMEREVGEVTRSATLILSHDLHVYENGHTVIVISGIGADRAARAAEGILNFRQPSVILSVGLAGGLDPALSVGTVVVPTKVLRQDIEQAFTIDGGEGILLSGTQVLTPGLKRQVAARYEAQAVDMEAASVAEVAKRRGVRFAAIKAISDDLDFPMPPMERFIGDDGKFSTGRFIAYAALRPHMWPVLSQLRSNTEKASSALCRVVSQIRSAKDVDNLLKTWAVKAG